MKDLKQLHENFDNERLEKLASMIRLALQEAPLLKEALFSEDVKVREEARKKAAFILQHIDSEILKIEENTGIPQAESWKRVRGESFFNTEEVKAIDGYFEFVRGHRKEIFEKHLTAKNTQQAHSKKVKFKA